MNLAAKFITAACNGVKISIINCEQHFADAFSTLQLSGLISNDVKKKDMKVKSWSKVFASITKLVIRFLGYDNIFLVP